MTGYFRAGMIPSYLLLCLLLGGASAAGLWANLLLQLLALPIIAWSLLADRPVPMPASSRQLLALAALLLLLILVQLVPLPPGLWGLFPNRGEIITGFQLLALPLPWLPISVAPGETLSSALWLLPAAAVLLGIARLGAFRAAWLGFVIIGVTVSGIALGAVQRAGSEAAYPYEVTNYGMATGFFSNANHMATLLMTAIPFAAALYLVARAKSRSAQHRSGLLVLLAGAAGVLIVGIAINGSLAGLGLSVSVLAASGLMLLSRKRKIPAWSLVPVALLTLAAVLVIFSRPLGNNLTAADAGNIAVSRQTSFANTLSAAADYFPIGSGIGTFNVIYPMYEDPVSLTTTYVNHAHSDFLEILLETGVAGVVLLGLFLFWWCRRTIAIWRSEEVDQFARAATVATAAIMAHSLVDYPLRTAAISAVFAACCALMAEPRGFVRQRDGERTGSGRHLSAD